MSKTSEDQTLAELHRIYRDLPVGLCYLDTEFRFISINHWLAAINGISVEEHLGRTIGELIPDVAAGVEAQFRQVIDTGEPIIGGSVEAETPAQPGVKRYFEHNYYPVRSDDGEVIGISCFVEDVTERKNAEDALAAAHRELVDAIESIPAAFILYDADGRMTRWNTKAREMFSDVADAIAVGTHIEDLTRARYERSMPGAPRERVEEAVQARLEKFYHPGEPFQERLPDGRWTEAFERRTSDGGIVCIRIDITERKAVEEALHDSEERFELAVRGTAEGVWDWNIVTGEHYYSARWEEILGYSPGEADQHIETWKGLLHPEDADRIQEMVRAHLEDRAPYEVEYRIQNKAGDYIWVRSRGQAQWDDKGAPIRMVGTDANITERKRAEAALQESEERYALAMQAVNEGIYDWNAESDEIYYSPRVHVALGIPPEEMKTRADWTDRIHPDDWPRYQEALVAHLKGQSERFECEFRYRRPDGTWRWARQHGLALRTEDGRVHRMAGSTGDITEQKELEEALRESEERFRAVVDNAPAGIYLKDIEGRFLLVNKHNEKLYGTGLDEVRGKTVFDLIPEEIAAEMAAHDAEVIERDTVVEVEMQVQHRDGSVRSIVATKFPIHGSGGGIVGIAGIDVDITERKAADEALRESEAQLHLVADNLPVLIAYVDGERRFRFVNKTYEDWTLCSIDEVNGQYVWDLLGEQAYEAIRPHIDMALSGNPVQFEVEIDYPDRKLRKIEATFAPDFGNDGQVKGYFSLVIDITERKRMEEALRASEERFRLIANAMPALISYVDADRVYRFVNRSYEKWFGKSSDEILGRYVWDVHGGEGYEELRVLIDTVLSGTSVKFDKKIPDTPGGTRWIQGDLIPDFDDDGNVRGYFVSTSDITDLKQSAEELRQSEDRFRIYAETSSDWFWEADENLRFSYFSNRFKSVTGVEPESLLGKTRQQSGVEGTVDPEFWRKHIDDLKNHRSFRDFVHPRTRPDGKTVWLSISGTPVIDESGVFKGYCGTGADITARKEAEDALRESEAQLHLVADNLPVLIAYVDDERRFRFVNKIYEDWTLRSTDEVIGQYVWDVLGEQAYEAIRPHIDMTLSGETSHIEVEIDYPDGKLRKVEATYAPDIGNDGKIKGYFVLAIDITERREAELLQRGIEARSKAVLDAATDAVITIDENGIIQQFNNSAERIFGYLAEEVAGQNVRILMPEPDRSRHEGYLKNFYNTGIAKIIGTGREVEAQRKDGSVFPVDLSISEVPSNGSRIFTAFIRDITERKAAEDQLHQVLKLEAVGQLTGGVAHDFNNLLAVIMGNAQLLEERIVDDDLHTLLGTIVGASQRGAELTHRLLAFSRRQPLNPKVVDLGALCAGIVGMLRRTLGETIEIDISSRGDLWNTLADPGQVENALLNLAINARDAMPGGGKLTIETMNAQVTPDDMPSDEGEKLGHYVMLQVSDTGTGMPAHVLERVFEPFFTTKEVGHSSGLGLSMIYGFAKQSGGYVTIESEEGRGTTVRLYLPKAEAAQEEVRQVATDEEMPRGHGEVILVVEDDPHVRELVVRQLESLGYVVREAVDGSTALDLLTISSRIDLVLCDVVLPGGMSGTEVYARAEEHRSDLKCLFMSGYAELGDMPLPQGTSLLDKPVAYASLARAVRTTLDARAA